MIKVFKISLFILLVILPLALILIGQLGLLSGHRPTDLGLKDGLLKPPDKDHWNVISSHAVRQAHTDYHLISPIKYSGSGKEAMLKLTTIVRNMGRVHIVTEQESYLYAEFQTKLLKFVDDVEFILDEPAGLIHMRSASRLGRKDFGVNRARLEGIRVKFNAS